MNIQLKPSPQSLTSLPVPAPELQPVAPSPVLLPVAAGTATLIWPELQVYSPSRRLIVLVPDGDVDVSKLGKFIWSLASPNRLEVWYVALGSDIYNEPRMRRCLATLAAITRDDFVHVETHVSLGGSWLQLLRLRHQTGDVIFCHIEQTTSLLGLNRRPVGNSLSSALNAPVYVLSGFYPQKIAASSRLLHRIASTALVVGIVVVFLALQLLIHLASTGGTYTVLLSVSLIAEYGLIALWNHFFNSKQI
jgi:hypothetical protein